MYLEPGFSADGSASYAATVVATSHHPGADAGCARSSDHCIPADDPALDAADHHAPQPAD